MTLNDVMALIFHYFNQFGSSRGSLYKSGWQSHNYGQFTMTMSSSKRLQRDRATPTYKILSRFINSRLDAQYLPSYRLVRKSYMSFQLVPKSVTSNDLEQRNGPFCVILPNLVVSGAHWVKVVDKANYFGQSTITMSSSNRLQRDRATPMV